MHNQRLEDLLRSEVTRGEFLRYSALTAIGLLGFAGISRTLGQLLGHEKQDLFTILKKQGAYGARFYGK